MSKQRDIIREKASAVNFGTGLQDLFDEDIVGAILADIDRKSQRCIKKFKSKKIKYIDKKSKVVEKGDEG